MVHDPGDVATAQGAAPESMERTGSIMERRATRRIALALFAAAVLGIFGFSGPAAATVYAPINLHVNWCPRTTYDVFGRCHNHRISGADFTIGGIPVTTNGSGIATATQPNGWNTIRVSVASYSGYKGSYVYCRDLVTNRVLFDGPSTRTVSIWTTHNHQVVCDWYLLT